MTAPRRRRRGKAQRRPESKRTLRWWRDSLRLTRSLAVLDAESPASTRAMLEHAIELIGGVRTMLPAIEAELRRRAAGHRPEPLPPLVVAVLKRWFR